MNTTYESSQYQNITHTERALRSLFGMTLLTIVSTGIIASPIAIFGSSMIAVYLVMTAITGISPVYVALKSLSKAFTIKHHHLVTN